MTRLSTIVAAALYYGVALTVVTANAASASFDMSGDYRFHLCDHDSGAVTDERLLPLAVNTYENVGVERTTDALSDICADAFRVRWRIENRMEARICVLDDTRVEPLIRVDGVSSVTRLMPRDPHDHALEEGLKEALPLVDTLSYAGEMIVLKSHNGRVCVALEKVEEPDKDDEDSN